MFSQRHAVFLAMAITPMFVHVCVCACLRVRVRVRARACLSTCVHVSARGEQWMGPFGECLEPIVCRAVSLCFFFGRGSC